MKLYAPQSQAGAEGRSLESWWSPSHVRIPKKLGAFSILIGVVSHTCLMFGGGGRDT